MTVETLPQWAEKLLKLLEAQRAIYLQLAQLGEQQSQCVERGDTESLLSLLGRRQQQIDQLLSLNSQLEPYKQRWAELWPELDEAQQARLRDCMNAVQQLLEDQLARDDRDRATLHEQREGVNKQLRQVKQGSQMNRAYANTSTPDASPRFTDRTG